MYSPFAPIAHYCHFPQRNGSPPFLYSPALVRRRPIIFNPFYDTAREKLKPAVYAEIFKLPPIVQAAPQSNPSRQFAPDTRMTPIGKGGQGRIFRVRSVDGHPYAFKTFEGARAERHMERESRANSRLPPSDLFPAFHGRITIGNTQGLLFDYIESRTLDVFMRQLRTDVTSGHCSSQTMERLIRSMIDRLLTACRLMHENGITHGDLKPKNIILDRRGKLRLCDLGLAVVHGIPQPASPALVASNAGTPGFMPPERSRVPGHLARDMLADKTDEQIFNAGDMYALGCIIFTLLQELRRVRSVMATGRRSPPPSPLPFDAAATNPDAFFTSVRDALQLAEGCSDRATPEQRQHSQRHRQAMLQVMRQHDVRDDDAHLVAAMTHPLAAQRPSAQAVLQQGAFTLRERPTTRIYPGYVPV